MMPLNFTETDPVTEQSLEVQMDAHGLRVQANTSYVHADKDVAEIGNEFAYLRVRKGEGDTGYLTFKGTLADPANPGIGENEFTLALDTGGRALQIVANIPGEGFYRATIEMSPVD